MKLLKSIHVLFACGVVTGCIAQPTKPFDLFSNNNSFSALNGADIQSASPGSADIQSLNNSVNSATTTTATAAETPYSQSNTSTGSTISDQSSVEDTTSSSHDHTIVHLSASCRNALQQVEGNADISSCLDIPGIVSAFKTNQSDTITRRTTADPVESRTLGNELDDFLTSICKSTVACSSQSLLDAQTTLLSSCSFEELSFDGSSPTSDYPSLGENHDDAVWINITHADGRTTATHLDPSKQADTNNVTATEPNTSIAYGFDNPDGGLATLGPQPESKQQFQLSNLNDVNIVYFALIYYDHIRSVGCLQEGAIDQGQHQQHQGGAGGDGHTPTPLVRRQGDLRPIVSAPDIVNKTTETTTLPQSVTDNEYGDNEHGSISPYCVSRYVSSFSNLTNSAQAEQQQTPMTVADLKALFGASDVSSNGQSTSLLAVAGVDIPLTATEAADGYHSDTDTRADTNISSTPSDFTPVIIQSADGNNTSTSNGDHVHGTDDAAFCTACNKAYMTQLLFSLANDTATIKLHSSNAGGQHQRRQSPPVQNDDQMKDANQDQSDVLPQHVIENANPAVQGPVNAKSPVSAGGDLNQTLTETNLGKYIAQVAVRLCGNGWLDGLIPASINVSSTSSGQVQRPVPIGPLLPPPGLNHTDQPNSAISERDEGKKDAGPQPKTDDPDFCHDITYGQNKTQSQPTDPDSQIVTSSPDEGGGNGAKACTPRSKNHTDDTPPPDSGIGTKNVTSHVPGATPVGNGSSSAAPNSNATGDAGAGAGAGGTAGTSGSTGLINTTTTDSSSTSTTTNASIATQVHIQACVLSVAIGIGLVLISAMLH
ncbi:unnamed protein product [Sympodiomycopsis kandeliae]